MSIDIIKTGSFCHPRHNTSPSKFSYLKTECDCFSTVLFKVEAQHRNKEDILHFCFMFYPSLPGQKVIMPQKCI